MRLAMRLPARKPGETIANDLDPREGESAEWKAWYQRFVPLVESGYRELFTVVPSDAPSLPTTAAGAQAVGAR